jgi:hypothetical protein
VIAGAHWAGGGVQAFLLFIPNAFAYFLICLHCNSKRKLQAIVLMMLFVCLFVIAQGFIELRHGGPAIKGDQEGSYLLSMENDAGEQFYRLRGLGEIKDPNDFAQVIACVIPLVFVFWRPQKMLQNIVIVITPVCVLLFGAYLTHSRGVVLALLAMVVVAVRRRIGTLPAVLIAGTLFLVASALHFTGGREISANAGEDRTALWGDGLQLLKAHPLFGVGFGDMGDYVGQTAHNSLVVCAAELGLFGLYFWTLFLFPTVRDALTIASPTMVSEGEPIVIKEGPFLPKPQKVYQIDKAETNRWGRLLVLSLTGFLVTGWFLSRAFVLTFFLLGGIVEVVYELALQRGMISPRLPLKRVLISSLGLALLLLLTIYILLRTVNVMR